MPDKLPTPEAKAPGEAPPAVATPPVPPRRSPGHRGADVRDTVAEMAAKAQEISQEAGSKMAAAMKDVINAAAGIAGFAVESARDLVQYMVRRGQMTQEEADKLIREAEAAQVGRPAPPPRPAPPRPPAAAPSPVAAPVAVHAEAPVRTPTPAATRTVAPPPPPPPAPKAHAAPTSMKAAPPAPAKKAAPPPPKAAAKKAAPPAKKPVAKSAGKSAPAAKKGAAKTAKKR